MWCPIFVSDSLGSLRRGGRSCLYFPTRGDACVPCVDVRGSGGGVELEVVRSGFKTLRPLPTTWEPWGDAAPSDHASRESHRSPKAWVPSLPRPTTRVSDSASSSCQRSRHRPRRACAGEGARVSQSTRPFTPRPLQLCKGRVVGRDSAPSTAWRWVCRSSEMEEPQRQRQERAAHQNFATDQPTPSPFVSGHRRGVTRPPTPVQRANVKACLALKAAFVTNSATSARVTF